MTDFRSSFEEKVVDGVVKSVCTICGRAIVRNVGSMRMHYTMTHGGGRLGSQAPDTVETMRAYHPLLSGMARASNEMTAALNNRGSGKRFASTSLAIYDANLRRLRALKSQLDQSYDPLLELLTRAAPPLSPHKSERADLLMQVPAGQSALESESETVPASSVAESPGSTTAMMSRVLEVLPEQYRRKYTLLDSYMKVHPDVIRVSASGRPVINGQELTGSSFVDAMRSLYVWRKQVELPRGAHEIIRTLQSLGAPSTLLSSAAARSVYQDILEGEESEGES